MLPPPRQRSLLGDMVSSAFGAMILAGIILGVERWLWTGAGFWIPVVLMPLFSFAILTAALNPRQLEQDIDANLRSGGAGGVYLIGIPLIHFFMTVLMFRGISLRYGDGMFANLPEAPMMKDWLRFTGDRFLSIVLIDGPGTFGYHLTQIEHNRTFWMSAVVCLYKVTVAVGFIKMLFVSYRHIMRRR